MMPVVAKVALQAVLLLPVESFIQLANNTRIPELNTVAIL
jgi:hypothetical protein